MTEFRWILDCGWCHGDGIEKHRWTHQTCPLCQGVGTLRFDKPHLNSRVRRFRGLR